MPINYVHAFALMKGIRIPNDNGSHEKTEETKQQK